ncbi:hypothetical protein HPB52_021910 [Rhipicephalus sanguineus]|uniref:BEN domain-containing protein n=1 Tax=Rhipicephalus sanguineus TaxID=34632 RepID=A0A9D4PXR7_RHISA|nr:hypothetical protein HPB52_021910 [Rhipicephalus sanguineus]
MRPGARQLVMVTGKITCGDEDSHQTTGTAGRRRAVTAWDELLAVQRASGLLYQRPGHQNIGGGVLVSRASLTRLEENFRDAPSKFARALLRVLFTDAELENKTLFGRQTNSHKDQPAKAGLDQKRVVAVLDDKLKRRLGSMFQKMGSRQSTSTAEQEEVEDKFYSKEKESSRGTAAPRARPPPSAFGPSSPGHPYARKHQDPGPHLLSRSPLLPSLVPPASVRRLPRLSRPAYEGAQELHVIRPTRYAPQSRRRPASATRGNTHRNGSFK